MIMSSTMRILISYAQFNIRTQNIHMVLFTDNDMVLHICVISLALDFGTHGRMICVTNRFFFLVPH